jgi:Zn-dependent peptidase ImmA (M78 family)
MKLLRPRYSRIERMILALLDKYEIKAAPVPIEQMVREEGIRLKAGDLGSKSGLMLRGPEGTVIGVNSTQQRTRQRFTIAHEFGHCLLHADMTAHSDEAFRVKYRDERSSLGSDVEEMEANFFAASLLMPKALLDRDQAQDYVDIDDAEACAPLARRYQVSMQAMSIRLMNLYGHLASF